MSVLIGAPVDNKCERNYINPPAPKCSNEYLKKENYLSEFYTKEEKRRVLENLGISRAFEWGQIDGYIENQTDLWNLLKKIQTELEKKITKELSGANAITQIAYNNEAYPNIKSLKDALDKALYQDISIVITATPSVAEYGTQIDSITYNWTLNKDNIIEQTFDGYLIDSSLRTITIEGPFTNTVTKVLTVNDGTGITEKSITVPFYSAIYYGSDLSNLDKVLSKDLNLTVTTNADQNQHIIIGTPYDYGVPTFNVNGFDGGFYLENDNYIINNIRYRLYYSDYTGLGLTTIKIWQQK